MKASKLVNNNNNWINITRLAQNGIIVKANTQNKKQYFFGLEEWNNCHILRKHKLAYLDSFRSFPRAGYYERIELINYCNGIVYYVGKLENVKQIGCVEIAGIRNMLTSEGWLKRIESDFNAIQDLRIIENNTEYMKAWNSKKIIAPTNESFILNIHYENFIFFESPVNLTALNINANNWKRLSQLYNIPSQFVSI